MEDKNNSWYVYVICPCWFAQCVSYDQMSMLVYGWQYKPATTAIPTQCTNLDALKGARVESISPNSDGADRVIMGFNGAHYLKRLNVPLNDVLICRTTVQVPFAAVRMDSISCNKRLRVNLRPSSYSSLQLTQVSRGPGWAHHDPTNSAHTWSQYQCPTPNHVPHWTVASMTRFPSLWPW